MPPQTPQPQQPLTPQQQTILDAIVFFLKKGELPTVREVGALVGLRSPATVLKHLRSLERGGWISINGKSRGIRLLRPVNDTALQAASPADIPGGPLLLPTNLRGLGATGKLHVLPLSNPAERNPSAGAVPPAGIIPLVGAIAAGRPFESYSDGFSRVPDGVAEDGLYARQAGLSTQLPSRDSGRDSVHSIGIDPRMFVESGEVFALQVEGDSMVNAGILDGDYVIIRRQSTVEDGEIAAVIIKGEGTLKRWRVRNSKGCTDEDSGGTKHAPSKQTPSKQTVTLLPANERFDPIEISEDDAKDVLVLGKYVGLVRGSLRFL